MRACLSLVVLFVVAACGSTAVVHDDPNAMATTLRRWDGSHVLREELLLNRSLGADVADSIYRLEKELLEPMLEQRGPGEILRAARDRSPYATRNAERIWPTSEPPLRDGSRGVFAELGAYPGAGSGRHMSPGITISSPERLIARMLREHNDDNPAGVLLAAWRRFSPATVERRPGMLAAAWQFDLDYPEAPSVALAESLLGPHQRSRLGQVPTTEFPAMRDRVEGYDGLLVPLDLLAPGAASPVLEIVDALAAGENVTVNPGDREAASASDLRFLRAALSGLSNGAAELAYIPAGTRRVTALFSYLVENAEARALLQLERQADGTWTLTGFDYQPAAASLTGNPGAIVDLMPLLRGARAGQ
jgi:hypothetical protein